MGKKKDGLESKDRSTESDTGGPRIISTSWKKKDWSEINSSPQSAPREKITLDGKATHERSRGRTDAGVIDDGKGSKGRKKGTLINFFTSHPQTSLSARLAGSSEKKQVEIDRSIENESSSPLAIERLKNQLYIEAKGNIKTSSVIPCSLQAVVPKHAINSSLLVFVIKERQRAEEDLRRFKEKAGSLISQLKVLSCYFNL